MVCLPLLMRIAIIGLKIWVQVDQIQWHLMDLDPRLLCKIVPAQMSHMEY